MIQDEVIVFQRSGTQANPITLIRIGPFLREFCQPHFDWIVLDVPAYVHQISPIIYNCQAVASLEKRTLATLLLIDRLNISVEDQVDEFG